jgi:hypothetical protein
MGRGLPVPMGEPEIAPVQVSCGPAGAVLLGKGMACRTARLTSGGTVRPRIDTPSAPRYIRLRCRAHGRSYSGRYPPRQQAQS